MITTPETTVCICSGVGIDNSYTHSLYFPWSNEQAEYFESKKVKEFTSVMYCRRESDIKVYETYTQARRWDYLYFYNPQDEKTYYYFITSVDYVNENTVKIHIEMDVLQTYLFNWTLRPCFIDRMTTKWDTVGMYTVDEGLDVGELVNKSPVDFGDLSRYYLMVMSTVSLQRVKGESDGIPVVEYPFTGVNSALIGEIYSGVRIYAWDVDSDSLANFQGLVKKLNDDGKIDAIINMWVYPKSLVQTGEPDKLPFNGTLTTADDSIVKTVSGSKTDEFYFNKPTTLGGEYVPRNNKLFTYPYSFLHVHNSMGSAGDFRFERFAGDIAFDVVGSIMPDGGVKVIPRNYNGVLNNYEESITLTGFPTCAWNSDTYKIWLAQHQHQLTASAVQGVASAGAGIALMAGGALTMNPALAMSGAGMAFSGVSSIGQQLAQVADMKTVPDQARGSQSSSINAENGKLTFSFYHKCVSEERARIIDDYFTMYGYKINRVEKPSIYNRSLFTYVKTVGSNIGGSFCNEDKAKINAIFDRGVTFWTDGSKIGAYDEPNELL